MTTSFKSATNSIPRPHEQNTQEDIASIRPSIRAVPHSTRPSRAPPAPRFWTRHASPPLRPPDSHRSYKTKDRSLTRLISRSTGEAFPSVGPFGYPYPRPTSATQRSDFGSPFGPRAKMPTKNRPAGQRPLNLFQGLLPCAFLALIAFVPLRQQGSCAAICYSPGWAGQQRVSWLASSRGSAHNQYGFTTILPMTREV
jgi:hypothetical protein